MIYRIQMLILILGFSMALLCGCKREAERPAAALPTPDVLPAAPLPTVDASEAEILYHLAQGRLCRRIHGTALLVARPMFAELLKSVPHPPALLQYYAAMIALESGELERAREGFSNLSKSESAPPSVRDRARVWEAACGGPQPLLDLPKPDPKDSPRTASEAGRARAFLKVDLPQAERLCAEALKTGADQALSLDLAMAQLAQSRADEAIKALDAVKCDRPIDECEIEKIRLPKRELLRTMRFYDPALLKCWADYHFLKAVELGKKHPPMPRISLAVGAALYYLGRLSEAEDAARPLVSGPPGETPPNRDRLAASALYGMVLWARSDRAAARQTWADMGSRSKDAVVLRLNALGDVPDLSQDLRIEGILLGKETLRRLRRQQSGLHEERFRDSHEDLFWALGWLCYKGAVDRPGSDVASYMADANQIGNILYSEASRFNLDPPAEVPRTLCDDYYRFDLKTNPPLFLAELAEVYIGNVLMLAKSNAYFEDVLRYQYDGRLLPSLEPAAWQVRESIQLLYALRDLSAPQEAAVRKEIAPSGDIYAYIMGGPQQAAPGPEEAVSSNGWFVVVIILVLTCVGWLLLRRRRRPEAAQSQSKEE